VPAADAGSAPVEAGSARLFWAQVVGNAGMFVGLLLVARALGPEGRGTIAFITVASKLIAWAARLGVSEATVVFAARRPEDRPRLLANLLVFSTAVGTAAAALASAVLIAVPALRPPGIGSAELAILAAAIVAATVSDSGYQFALGCGRFGLHASVTSTTSWLYAAGVAALWLDGNLSTVEAALAWVAIHVVRAGWLWSAGVAAVGAARPRLALLVESMRFGLRAWVGTVADGLNFRVDQLLVALLATETSLGLYAVAVNASEVLLYLPTAAATALLPVAASAGASARHARTLDTFRSALFATTASVMLAALAGPLLIPAVFGHAFDGAVVPFLLLLPGVLGAVALAVFTSGLVAASLPGRSSFAPFASLATGLALDLVLIPAFGASGAAAAASASFLAGGATAILVYRAAAPFAWADAFVPRRRDLDLVRTLAAPLARRSRRRAAPAAPLEPEA
jgi:O-antigen/teichoic acid export membrane protein